MCEPAPHPSHALHTHSLFVPTALEDHNTSIRNTANKETGTWEFGICRANREVSKPFALDLNKSSFFENARNNARHTPLTPHLNLKRTHAHVVTPSSYLFFDLCFRHRPPNQIILWVHGSETLMSSSMQNAHQTETAIVFVWLQ